MEMDHPMNQAVSPSAEAEMNADAPSSPADVMPSKSSSNVAMESDPIEQSSPFDNMEGEREAENVPAPQAVPLKINKSKKYSKGMLANMSQMDAKKKVVVPKVGAEVDLKSMPGSNPQASSAPVVVASATKVAVNIPMSGTDDDDNEPPAELDAQMRKNGYEPTNKASEEAKMNSSSDDESEIGEPVVSDGMDRMNTQSSSNGNEFQHDTSSSQVTILHTEAQPVDIEDDVEPDSDNTMNANTMNSAVGHSVEKMNAAFALGAKVSTSETFGMMNKAKASAEPPKQAQTVQIMVQTQAKSTEVESLKSNDMEQLSNDGMAQAPVAPIQMPSSSTGLMPETVEQVSMDIVPEDHETTMTNDPALTSAPATHVEKPVPVAAPKPVVSMNDGDGMGDMSKLHHSEAIQQAPPAGFMDQGDPSEDDAQSQMNTITPGLDMMGSVAFLGEDQHTSELLQVAPAKPFYNQYASQTSQPLPIPISGVIAPLPTHPYGLPYYHRDPFMPLQTPYYHIPSYDNPQRNPALTPYYNPFVNPPPPIPPSVPAAPSFFPFHHHQHMIPPYFPYPPAPVLQPGPFPPYALPSHLAPGEREPSAKFSKLPQSHTDDPF